FLLINHPLDCPIVDQGGECPLQDQALGYGEDVSRFTEKKRVVEDKDIGPLIEMEMTRCIHCTRCVRFGREIAGIMELGAVGRGEHTEITAYVGSTVDSEVSGNMIDLCPVGALTSKPYRFSARAWELKSHESISPHDCIGTNLHVQTLRNEVKRVLPRDNEAVNQCWLADRDRYSYESVNSGERAVVPVLKSGDHYEPTEWRIALERVSREIGSIVSRYGADQVGALISPTCSSEEHYLFQKVVRGLGCGNVDHRLRQQDFGDDATAPVYPGSEIPLSDVDRLGAIVLVGSNVRKEQPLLGIRVRTAARNGAKVFAVNALDYDFHFDVSAKRIVEPSALPGALARVAAAVASELGAQLPDEISAWAQTTPVSDEYELMARAITADPNKAAVVLGDSARQHPRASVLRGIANWIRSVSGVRRIDLAEANSAGAWLAGCVPHRGPRGRAAEISGANALEMVREPRRAYILYGLDSELDCIYGSALGEALTKADFVVTMSAFRAEAMNHADVLLPVAPFTESAGSWVNLEGQVQLSRAAVTPKGEARPGWKVLRVLGNQLGLGGFEYVEIDEVRAELALAEQEQCPIFETYASIAAPADEDAGAARDEFHRIMDIPLYRVDPYVRRAPALQATRDNPQRPVAGLNPAQFEKFGLREGAIMNLVTPDGSGISIEVRPDDRVPENCIYAPSGYSQTAPLGTARRVALEEV
ncbi:MAG: NADH dehydrogenase (quinone) subunit G, partial [Proteobacteria bacterium]